MVLANDFQKQWLDIGEDVLQAVDRVGKSGWLVLGEEVRGFEAKLSALFAGSYVTGCASGLDALEIGLRCLDLQQGERVLTTPLSAFASSLAIIRAGGEPVFIDVDSSGAMDLSIARQVLQQHPEIKFLLPVHIYGQAMNLERLENLKQEFDLQIVEDCAQAIGAKWNNSYVGSVGQCAAVSFYPTKNLGAMGDGGALVTPLQELDGVAKTLRDYGQSAKYVHSVIGLNSRLDEVQAAILNDALLPRLDGFNRRRKSIANYYNREIEHDLIAKPRLSSASQPVWHLYPLIIQGCRDEFLNYLKENAIGGAVHYPKLISDQPALSGREILCLSDIKNAQTFAEQEVSLPIHPYLTDGEIEKVVKVCNDWRPQ